MANLGTAHLRVVGHVRVTVPCFHPGCADLEHVISPAIVAEPGQPAELPTAGNQAITEAQRAGYLDGYAQGLRDADLPDLA